MTRAISSGFGHFEKSAFGIAFRFASVSMRWGRIEFALTAVPFRSSARESTRATAAAFDHAVAKQRFGFAGGQYVCEPARGVAHARLIGHQDQLLGAERAGELAGQAVRQDVERGAVVGDAERHDDRHEPARQEELHELDVDRLDVPDVAQVGGGLPRHGRLAQFSQLWNGAATQSGSSVTVKSMNYNGNVPAGGSYTGVGFTGSWNGTNGTPTGFAVNGVACN